MALNINYQGNVFDSNGDSTDCYYQAYSPAIGKWSDVRETEFGQYNVNYGDGDIKTQSGSVSNGEAILIAAWTGSPDRGQTLTEFAVVSFIYDGTDNTLQDIKLDTPNTPSCNFGLLSEGKVGQSVTASSYASLTYQWTYDSKAHYQRREWYGTVVFDGLSITGDYFKFEGEYSTLGTNTYTSHGDYEVWHRVVNSYNMQSECSKSIRIRYRSPVGGILFNPENLVVGDPISVSAEIQDIDSRITSISHVFDGVEVEENSNIIFSYNKTLSNFREYYAEQFIRWSDGFEDLVVYVKDSPGMINTPPDVDLTIFKTEEAGLEGLHKSIVQVYDREGPVSKLTWSIWFLNTNSNLPNPYFRCTDDGLDDTFRLIYQRDFENTELIKDLLFAVQGTYKIRVSATDMHGLSGFDEHTIDVDEVCVDTGKEKDCEDLEEAVAAAIEKYKREQELIRANERVESINQCEMVVVTDSLAGENYLGGEPVGSTSGSVATGDIGGDNLGGSSSPSGDGDSSSITGA